MKHRMQIPQETMPVRDQEKGAVAEKNIVIHLLEIVVENTPQKTNTETTVAFSIRKKIDAWKGDPEMEIDKVELDFIKEGLEKLRAADRIAGSKWYFLTTALNEAKPA